MIESLIYYIRLQWLYSLEGHLKDSEVKAMERILELDGECMQDLEDCRVCPFYSQCFASYCTERPMTPSERMVKASDAIVMRNFFPDE